MGSCGGSSEERNPGTNLDSKGCAYVVSHGNREFFRI